MDAHLSSAYAVLGAHTAMRPQAASYAFVGMFPTRYTLRCTSRWMQA